MITWVCPPSPPPPPLSLTDSLANERKTQIYTLSISHLCTAEPTSGLDSFAALKVMEMMAKYCKEGRLIVCTIHQPRSQVTRHATPRHATLRDG